MIEKLKELSESIDKLRNLIVSIHESKSNIKQDAEESRQLIQDINCQIQPLLTHSTLICKR